MSGRQTAANPRLALVATHPMTFRFLLRGQLDYLARHGFEVFAISSPGPLLERVAAEEGVTAPGVPMSRSITPLGDLLAALRLTRLLRRLRPDIVNAGTPKAGLLGMLAARLAGVPIRVYTLRGLRLETARGWRRRLFAAGERLASRSAHRVVCVSESLRRRYLELGLGSAARSRVLGAGSSNGVDVERFRPASGGGEEQELRRRLGVSARELLIGFVGRLTRDKGIVDLSEIFQSGPLESHPEARLLLLGDFEPGDPVPAPLRRRLADDPRVILTGFVDDSAPYYRVLDLLAFPSYREGFPNVPLEAAASGLPVAGYAATGTVDAVEDGTTGTLVPVGDRTALAAAIAAYLERPDLRRLHGTAGRRRAQERFARERVWELWSAEYRSLLEREAPDAA